jgi:anti-sigma B factor antagonist
VALALALEPDSSAGGHAALEVSGELDIATAPRLRSAIGDLMGQGVRHLELDLEACTFVDSSGMGALLWASHRMHAVGGDLVVTHVNGAPARALEISGVENVIEVRH